MTTTHETSSGRPTPPVDSRTHLILSRSALAVVAISVYVRLFFGIDLSDESFYAALPWSFILGHRPLVHEIAVHQFAGLMLVPLVKLQLAVTGSADGIILYFRHLYFVVALACAALIARWLAPIAGRARANWIGAFALAYIPFAIPSLSYNTLASFGFLAGLILTTSVSILGRPRLELFLGTLLLAIASIAYPPIVIATAPTSFAGGFFHRHSRRADSFISIWGPIGLAAFVALVFVIAVMVEFDGLAGFERMASFNEALARQGGGWEKLGNLFRELRLEGGLFVAMGATLVVAGITIRRGAAWAIGLPVLLATGPALWLASDLYKQWSPPYTTTTFLVLLLGLWAIWELARTRLENADPLGRRLQAAATLSFVAAACIVWASANGLRNAALGLLPAAAIGLAALPGLRQTDRRSGEPILFAAFMASLLAFQVQQLYAGVYRDSPIPELSERLTSGPYAGIATTPERKRFVTQLAQDLEEFRGDSRTIAFFDYMPAGYLFTDLRPVTPALWMLSPQKILQGNPAIRGVYARRFEEIGELPDLVVVMERIELDYKFNLKLPPDDPVLQLFTRGNYELVLIRPRSYRILRRGVEPEPPSNPD